VIGVARPCQAGRSTGLEVGGEGRGGVAAWRLRAKGPKGALLPKSMCRSGAVPCLASTGLACVTTVPKGGQGAGGDNR
jgi:hypothetical protein